MTESTCSDYWGLSNLFKENDSNEEMSTMKIRDIQSSLQSAFEALEYYKERDERFDQMEAECVRVREEKEQLDEKNKKIADELQKTKQEVQFYKHKFEQESFQLSLMRERLSGLQQQLGLAEEENHLIYKEKETMAKDLEDTRLQVEYYRRIDNLKCALKSVAEFPGLSQMLQQKNNSNSEGSKGQRRVDPEVSMKSRYVLKVHEIDNSLNCPICFEPCGESVEHSTCSLACGHFFGRSCITSWIKKTSTGSSKCPQCLRSAKLIDIRNHYLPEMYVGDEKI